MRTRCARAVVLALMLSAVGCTTSPEPLSDGGATALASACQAVDFLASGQVAELDSGAGEVIWAEMNAAGVAAEDARLQLLADYLAEARELIAPDDEVTGVTTPEAFEQFVAALDGAERECVRFADLAAPTGW